MKQNGQWLSHAHADRTPGFEIEAEGLPGGLVDDDLAFEPAATQLELDVRLVGLKVVADDVAHGFAVHAEELVAGEEPCAGQGEPGRDRHNAGGRHG